MKKILRELRRREVFRTTGLYVGICWILIEVGSVVLPAFGAPDWLVRGTIIVAVAGFPVMLVLAWFFDVNEKGISLQDSSTDIAAENLGVRKSDFAIMGVLAVALLVSVSLNLSGKTPVDKSSVELISVVVADSRNSTGDPAFDLLLNEALVIGLEAAPNIAVFSANPHKRTNDDKLSTDPALDLAPLHREAMVSGADYSLAGRLEKTGNEFRVSVNTTQLANGKKGFTLSEKAASREAVLEATDKLLSELKEKLGGVNANESQDESARSLRTASLKAATAFAAARQSEAAGKNERAAELYEQAIAADPNFGPAYANAAVLYKRLDLPGDAAISWIKAQELSSTLSERERLRSEGRYYSAVEMLDSKAASVYKELVAKYPGDIDARERYALTLFRLGDFQTASEQTRLILQSIPANVRQLIRLAMYAMYAGDWESATEAANKVISANPENAMAHLPIAMAALNQGDYDGAREAYQRMAGIADDNAVTDLGLADIDLYLGNWDDASKRLLSSIDTDIENEQPHNAALKHLALAQSFIEQEKLSAATSAAASALQLSDASTIKVSAAMIYLTAGNSDAASKIIDEFSALPESHNRAYAKMLNGMTLEHANDQTGAIIAFRDALDIADTWLIRFQLGKAYLHAGNFPAALDEFTSLYSRRSEATAVFGDAMPTYRHVAELPYWTGRVQEALNISSAARASYEDYLSLRQQGGVLAEDAKSRLEALKQP